jgi:hypothetical protein
MTDDRKTPYKAVHEKPELSLELNFRSFLAGEGESFLTPVPADDLVLMASVGAPITLSAKAPYSQEELQEIAQAVARGRGTLTVLAAGSYAPDVLAAMEKEAPGQVRLA